MIAGAAFAIGWTPCIGPTLTAILNAAAIKDTLAEGACAAGHLQRRPGGAVPVSGCGFQRATTRSSAGCATSTWSSPPVSGVRADRHGARSSSTGELTDLNIEGPEVARRSRARRLVHALAPPSPSAKYLLVRVEALRRDVALGAAERLLGVLLGDRAADLAVAPRAVAGRMGSDDEVCALPPASTFASSLSMSFSLTGSPLPLPFQVRRSAAWCRRR
jgi:hypothetical protein